MSFNFNHTDLNETTIRPQSLNDFIGQDSLKKNLKVFLQAALSRNKSLDHILISGPPGLGKTSLAQIITKEVDSSLLSTSGVILDRQGDLASILTSLEPNQNLFIDEIHRINRSVEELLYPALEDFNLDIMIGQGAGAKTIKVDLPPFTLIGATTRAGLLSNPLRDRFGINLHLDFYNAEELKEIVLRTAQLLGTVIENNAALEIGKRSRGTPRIANRLLKRILDFALVWEKEVIDLQMTKKALLELQIDSKGLDPINQKILQVIMNNYQGGPVGLNNLCTALSESADTIENYAEPFLIREGFIQRTSKGRIITQKGQLHLKNTNLL